MAGGADVFQERRLLMAAKIVSSKANGARRLHIEQQLLDAARRASSISGGASEFQEKRLFKAAENVRSKATDAGRLHITQLLEAANVPFSWPAVHVCTRKMATQTSRKCQFHGLRSKCTPMKAATQGSQKCKFQVRHCKKTPGKAATQGSQEVKHQHVVLHKLHRIGTFTTAIGRSHKDHQKERGQIEDLHQIRSPKGAHHHNAMATLGSPATLNHPSQQCVDS
mmetsp:Transcript_121096/g.241215  ORF Transcript_121096/g.241215 Transcript_121096/m.241215 type:complete len:224 (+) Transcript_121096:146-817(+)